MYYLSAKMLEKQGACFFARDEFRKLFGARRVPVDEAFVKTLRQGDYLYHRVWWPAWKLYTKAKPDNPTLARKALALYHRNLSGSASDAAVAKYLNEIGDLWTEYKAAGKTYAEWKEEGRMVRYGEHSIGQRADGEHVFLERQTAPDVIQGLFNGSRGITYATY